MLLSLVAVLSFFLSFPFVSAFTYSFGTPSECDNIPLTWTGGTPPFQLLIIPVFATPRNISIPSSAFSDGKGSYTFQLPLAKNSQILLSMSDATGFNSGGSTNVLTVGASRGGSCNTTDPGIAFSFQLNSALQQCRPFVFSGYDQAIQPATIYAVIPGGNAVVLSPPTGSTSFSWDATVAQGTSMIFFMTDSQGRQGGSSDVRTVGFSDDSSCLSGSSPTSTQSSPGSSQSAPSATSSKTQASSTPSTPSTTISIAAIAGTVVGGLIFLAVVITLVLFFLKRKRDTPGVTAPSLFKRHSRGMGPGIDLAYDPGQAPAAQPYGKPQNDFAPASNYPQSQSSGAPFSELAYYDSPPESHYQPSSRYIPPSQFDAASQYSSSRYQFSDTNTQYEYNPYQQHPGVYNPNAQLYPPNPNYPTGNPHPADPFHSTPPPTLSGMQSARFSMQTSQPSAPSEVQSNAQRKAVVANASNPTPRFIVHTDVEDALPPNEDGIVELPPQYSERRGPVVVNPTPPGASGKSASGP